jgi:hypothetical protein
VREGGRKGGSEWVREGGGEDTCDHAYMTHLFKKTGALGTLRLRKELKKRPTDKFAPLRCAKRALITPKSALCHP